MKSNLLLAGSLLLSAQGCSSCTSENKSNDTVNKSLADKDKHNPASIGKKPSSTSGNKSNDTVNCTDNQASHNSASIGKKPSSIGGNKSNDTVNKSTDNQASHNQASTDENSSNSKEKSDTERIKNRNKCLIDFLKNNGIEIVEKQFNENLSSQQDLNIFQNSYVIVNAANESLKIGMGGLNKGITDFVKNKGGITDGEWTKLQKNQNISFGEFAISKYNNSGIIYHAIGPKANDVGTRNLKNLTELKNCICKLYTDLINKAINDTRYAIVLPIISGAIFAGEGQDESGTVFSKADFLQHVYEGIEGAIAITNNTRPKIRIFFNIYGLER